MRESYDLVVIGDVVLPDRVLRDGFVAVSGEAIVAVGDGPAPQAARRFDARGKLVFPGVVDGQVHSGSQANQEGIGIATRAAAAGGVTTIVDMPYDDPQPVVNAALFREKVAIVARDAHADVALYGTMAKHDGIRELLPMVEAGACGFKFSTFESHPTRFPRIAPLDMLHAMQVIGPTGLAVGVHNENQEIVDRLVAELQAAGATGPEAHGQSRPPIAEALAIAEIYELAAAAGARGHVVHCSIGRGFDVCEAYKAMGVRASIETCVHYLTLSEDDVFRLGAMAKINPPLRPQAEVEKLWSHVAAGHIDFVSSDHVAWSRERKSNNNIHKNSSGAPGLETLLPAFFTGAEAHGLPPTVTAKLLAEGPARHFCLYPRKGAIRVGADADLAIVERTLWQFDARDTLTAADWSPYQGLTFTGRVAATFVRGAQVWDGRAILSQPGFGKFIRPVHGRG